MHRPKPYYASIKYKFIKNNPKPFQPSFSQFSAPGSVSSVTATNATAKSITFQWKKPLVSNGVIKGYSVFIKHGERCLYRIKYGCVDCQRDCLVDQTQNDVSDKYFKK